MSDASELQFDQAEFREHPGTTVCAVCGTGILGSYFQVNGRVVCEACRYRVEASLNEGSGAGRFVRALGAGTAAAIAGAVLYYAIGALTGYEFGLIAIVVGFAVGAAVRWGSRGRGGWRYQTLAMGLTYLSITGTYIPPIISAVLERDRAGHTTAQEAAVTPAAADDPATTSEEAPGARRLGAAGLLLAIVLLFALACAAPFLAGAQNLMGLIIIGIGLYEAWKINKRVPLTITGPHALARPPATMSEARSVSSV
jgi:hypothetical protein